MALMTRLSRLLRADLHAVLDRLEEPASLLRQSIRDMERACADQAEHVAELCDSRESLGRRARDLDATAAGIDAELDLCFDAGDETLARKLLRRKLEATKHAAELRSRLEALTERHRDAEAALERQRAELEHLQRRAECIIETRSAPTGLPRDTSCAVSDDEVEVAWLREQQRRAAS